jgi:RNA polymerase sporulation-specific sigma factor
METGEEGATLEDILGIDGMEEGVVEKVALRAAIDRLSERERKVVLLRYFKNLTQEQTARVIKVSQVQISRLERKALGQLREYLSMDG